MIWVVLLVLAAAAMAPLLLTLRRGVAARGRREAGLALHRAHLADLDRDLAEGRIAAAEHAASVLEVQRRLLAAGREADAAPGGGSRVPVLLTIALVPLAAFLLYLFSSASPGLPGAPLAERQASEREEDALIQNLRQRLVKMDPTQDQTRQGYLLLGHSEEALGHWAQAAEAFRVALTSRFDPTLAAETGEAISRSEGRVTDAAAALFKRALDAAPADAPWRSLAEQRIREAGGPVRSGG